MTASKTTINRLSADFRSQLETLRSHEDRIQQAEAKKIIDIALEGKCLAGMRAERKKQDPDHWEKQLVQETGLSANEIHRRIMIGNQWAAFIDTEKAQAILQQLPGDTLKLESICRIPKTELAAFLTEHDCRRLDRDSVKKAVQVHLGVSMILREFDKAAKKSEPVA